MTSIDPTTLLISSTLALGTAVSSYLTSDPDDGRTGCPPFLLPPDCTLTYAKFLGNAYTIVHVVFAIAVVSGFIFTLAHAYTTLKSKGFNPIQSVQVRLHVFIFIGMLLLVFRLVDPFGWSRRIPFQAILVSYDLSGTMTLSIGLDIVFDWLRVTMIAENLHLLSSKFRYICMAFQGGTCLVLLTLSVLQCTIGPWWLFHSLKTAVYILVSGLMVGLFLRYGFRVQRIIKDHEDMRDKHTLRGQCESHEYEDTAFLPQQGHHHDIPSSIHSQHNTVIIGSVQQHQLAGGGNDGVHLSDNHDEYSQNINMLGHTPSNTTPSGFAHDNTNNSDNYQYHQLEPKKSSRPIVIGSQKQSTHLQNEEHIFEPIQHVTSSGSLENTSFSSPSSLSLSQHNIAASTSQSTLTPAPPPKLLKKRPKKRSAGAKVPKLIILIILNLALMIILWAYVLYNEISHQCTIQNSCNLVKDKNISLIFAALYDIIHLAAYVSICLFFGMQNASDSSKKSTNTNAKTTSTSKNRTGFNSSTNTNQHLITNVGGKSYVMLNDGTQREATASEITQHQHNNNNNNNINNNNNNNNSNDNNTGSASYKASTRSLFPKSTLFNSSLPRSGVKINNGARSYTSTKPSPAPISPIPAHNDGYGHTNDHNISHNNQHNEFGMSMQRPTWSNQPHPDVITEVIEHIDDNHHHTTSLDDNNNNIQSQQQQLSSVQTSLDPHINHTNTTNNNNNNVRSNNRRDVNKPPTSTFYGSQAQLEQKQLYLDASQPFPASSNQLFVSDGNNNQFSSSQQQSHQMQGTGVSQQSGRFTVVDVTSTPPSSGIIMTTTATTTTGRVYNVQDVVENQTVMSGIGRSLQSTQQQQQQQQHQSQQQQQQQQPQQQQSQQVYY